MAFTIEGIPVGGMEAGSIKISIEWTIDLRGIFYGGLDSYLEELRNIGSVRVISAEFVSESN